MMDMVMNFTPDNWYWKATDGRIYSSRKQSLIDADDEDYLAWGGSVGMPTPWPKDAAGEESNAALAELLATYGLSLFPPTMAQVKAALKARVDEAAELERLKYITPGAGQAMTYQEKVTQAVNYSKAFAAHLANEENVDEPNSAEYPLLAAGLGLDGDTLLEVAETVIFSYALWQQIGSAIEATRLRAKATIDAAETVEAAQNIFANIQWPNLQTGAQEEED